MERPSRAVAHLLRTRRRLLGYRLQDVERHLAEQGQPATVSTLSRIERGQVDPGSRRLGALLRLYGIAYQAVGDLLELEARAVDLPEEASPEVLYRKGEEAWKHGDQGEALAYFLQFQRVVPKDEAHRVLRQRGLLTFGFAASTLGKYRLAWNVIEGVLIEGPESSLLVTALVQAAVAWRGMGALEPAFAFIDRAAHHAAAARPSERGQVLHCRAKLLSAAGRVADAEAALEEALANYRDAGREFDAVAIEGLRVRNALERNDLKAALAAARAGKTAAEEHGFADLVTQRMLDEGRVLVALGRAKEAMPLLKRALADAITRDDHETRFYAHYHLWKAYGRNRQPGNAELELAAAVQFVRFVEEAAEEAEEVRKHTPVPGRRDE